MSGAFLALLLLWTAPLAVTAASSCEEDEVSLLQLNSRMHSAQSGPTVVAPRSQESEACSAVDTVPVKGSKMNMSARGFITCCNLTISKPQMLEAMKSYLEHGGRLIDTAPDYGHEETVGKAVLASGISREKIWLSSKVDTDGWRAALGSPKKWALGKVEDSLKQMNVSYLDSMVLHAGPRQVALQAPQPPDAKAAKMWHTIGADDHVEMWQGLMEAKKQGKVRNIGVCETSRSEVEHLINKTGEVPAIALLWYHPWMPKEQKDYVAWAQKKGMAVSAYGLFNFKKVPGAASSLEAVEAAKKAAKRHNVTFGQLVAKWALDKGVAFASGMYHQQYLEEDLSCLNFTTDAQDEDVLSSAAAWTCKDNSDYSAMQYFPGCRS